MSILEEGTPVRITKPNLRETGRTGKITYYDTETLWYSVDLDEGPPWRGKYEREEIEALEREGEVESE